MVKVELLRPWPVGDVTHRPGAIIEVPAARADRMEKTSPPWAKRVKAESPKVEEAAKPPKGKDGGS